MFIDERLSGYKPRLVACNLLEKQKYLIEYPRADLFAVSKILHFEEFCASVHCYIVGEPQ